MGPHQKPENHNQSEIKDHELKVLLNPSWLEYAQQS